MSKRRARAALFSLGGLPERIGLQADPYPTRRHVTQTAIGSIVVAVGCLCFLPEAENIWQFVSFLIGVLMCCLLLVSTLASPYAYTPGTVRVVVDDAHPRLSFRDHSALTFEWFTFVLGMLWAGAAGVLVLISIEKHGASDALHHLPRSMLIAFGVAVFSIGHMVRKVRQESEASSGIHLTPTDIIAAGEGAVHRVAWGDLLRAATAPQKLLGPHLVLFGDDRQTLGAVSVRYLGSDPNVIAAFLHYFRDRPEERELLSDPERAIARFEQHLARLEAEGREQNAAEPSV